MVSSSLLLRRTPLAFPALLRPSISCGVSFVCPASSFFLRPSASLRFFSSLPSTMSPNPFQEQVLRPLEGTPHSFYDITALKDPRLERLPYCIRVLLECALRNCDGVGIKADHVESILDWAKASEEEKEVPFMPARVLLQDFTGVPALVDLAAMRDAMANLGGNASDINPLVPVDLVIDHSVQVDKFGTPDALKQNQDIEMSRNAERFAFLKWGSKAFDGVRIVPPGSGIVHQVNLEFLARCVFEKSGGGKNSVLYPDSVVGTDSHTTMIDGLGVVGWGVGGIEAEAVMLGQPISLVLPKVVGVDLKGKLAPGTTATDLVLTLTQMLRQKGVVGKFVEFYGPGCATLSLADRATVANMSPEYGATMGFFPVDAQTLKYLKQTGRSEAQVGLIEKYLKAQKLFVTPELVNQKLTYSDSLSLDLSTVEACLAGPKRPQDRVAMKELKKDFLASLTNPVGFKGYGLSEANKNKPPVEIEYEGKTYQLKHGSVVIAAITSCTNTSNPSVMLGAGLLAKKANELGLKVQPYIKTSLSPGSKAVTEYFRLGGLTAHLEALGFYHSGYGCQTCIGNSGDLPTRVADGITKGELVVAAVLSGNRNFEGRVHPLTRANYLASPPLVVAYALAGRVDIDFETEHIGMSKDGRPIFLREIWPTHEEIAKVENETVRGELFKTIYQDILNGTPAWRALKASDAKLYPWDSKSTYIHNPPFFTGMKDTPEPIKDIEKAYCLLNLGDSITTDHISPAGNIAKDSAAAKYLTSLGVQRVDFNTYGSRRGNDEIMRRGTFANIRLINKMCPQSGPKTVHIPSNETVFVSEAAERYAADGTPLIILAGGEYGSGSSRDWAAKGPYLLGVKAVIANSFERIHRTNLVGMGILPLQFLPGQSADSLGLTGKERFSLKLHEGRIKPGQTFLVTVEGGKDFDVKCRVDTDVEVLYFQHGGILQYVLRTLKQKSQKS